MTNERAIKILKHRTECGKADTIKCIQTGCENCDLFYKEKNLAEASAIAIKALEKQIPKKPNKGNNLSIQNSYEFVNLCCPSCGEDVGKMETYTNLNVCHHRFCDGCGQRIDWEVE